MTTPAYDYTRYSFMRVDSPDFELINMPNEDGCARNKPINMTDSIYIEAIPPEKSCTRKTLNIAAKVALIAATVFVILKVFFSAITATIAAPYSLALTLPGIFAWSSHLSKIRLELIYRINDKINRLI